MYIVHIFPDVNLNVTKGGMARVVEASVFALMAAIVIMLLVHVTVLQDGRYLLLTEQIKIWLSIPQSQCF